MHPVLFTIGPVTIYTFGIFVFIGFLIASFIIWKRGIEAHLSEEDLFDGIIVLTLAGLIGARGSYILFNFESFGFQLWKWFSIIRNPGMMFVGGLMLGLLCFWIFVKRKRWDFFTAADVFAAGICFAQAVGWVGAFFSGFGMGREVESMGVVFVGYENPRFPTQLIAAFGFFMLFYWLWKLEERYRTFEWYKGKRTFSQTGFLTFLYLIGYGIISLVLVGLNGFWVYLYGAPVGVVLGFVMIIIGSLGLYVRSGRSYSDDRGRMRHLIVVLLRRIYVYTRQRARRVVRRVRR